MERTEVLDLMSGLKLYGMRSAYDETLATALKRKHEPQRFKWRSPEGRDLREASALDQISAHRRQAAAGWATSTTSPSRTRRSMRLSCATWPAAASSPNSATVVLVGGTGTGKTHLAIAIARAAFASDQDRAGASSPPSILSISSRPKVEPDDKDAFADSSHSPRRRHPR